MNKMSFIVQKILNLKFLFYVIGVNFILRFSFSHLGCRSAKTCSRQEYLLAATKIEIISSDFEPSRQNENVP